LEEFRRILIFGKDHCFNGSGSNRYGKEFCQISDYQWNGSGCTYIGPECYKITFDQDPFGLINGGEALISFGGGCLDEMLLNGKYFGMGV
jgi:hypothetical protein